MRTVGEILKKAREEKNLNLKRVAKETKIRLVYLEALEKDKFQSLPSPAITRGFIKNYAEYLGLSSKEVLAVFRRDFDEKKLSQTGSFPVAKPTFDPKFSWTPKLTTLAALVVFLLLFVFYLIWQYRSLISAPYY